MLSIPRTARIFLATEPTDMRKSFDGLFALAEHVIREDPFSGHLFVFRNRRRDRWKVLWWDRDGLAIFYKRLEQGRYQFPGDVARASTTADGTHTGRLEIRSDELALLLEGIHLETVRRRNRYGRPPSGAVPSMSST